MKKTITTIRFLFLTICLFASYVTWFNYGQEEHKSLTLYLTIGALLGTLLILTDILLKGFSLRGLSAVSFGLGIGALIAYLISHSPLFEYANPETVFLFRVSLYAASMYLCTVIALRGKDDFNLIIPYVRFSPQKTENKSVVLDTSVLIDGRIHAICESRFLNSELIIPQFVVEELQYIASSKDPQRQAKGRKGIDTLNALKKLSHVNLRIYESELTKRQVQENKVIFLAQSLKAQLISTDYNVSKLAEFHGVTWLNINALAKALNPEISVGESIEVKLVKPGKDETQAVGYLADGSMVVVNDGSNFINQIVNAEVVSVLPSVGGRMIFAQRPYASTKHQDSIMALAQQQA